LAARNVAFGDLDGAIDTLSGALQTRVALDGDSGEIVLAPVYHGT